MDSFNCAFWDGGICMANKEKCPAFDEHWLCKNRIILDLTTLKMPISLARIHSMAEQILKDPEECYNQEFSDKVTDYVANKRKANRGAKLLSLSHKASQLAGMKDAPYEMYIDGLGCGAITGWVDAFDAVWTNVYDKHKELLSDLEAQGCMNWVHKKNKSASLLDNFGEKNGVTLHFRDYSELCSRLQWLLLVTGHKLHRCVLCFPKSEKKMKVPPKKNPAPAPKAPEREKPKQRSRWLIKQEEQARRLQARKKRDAWLREAYESRTSREAKKEAAQEAAKARELKKKKSTNNVHDEYIVIGGVVQFVNQSVDRADMAQKGIARSGSAYEDTWKGFGVGRADTDGKFGGIIGEDFTD